MSELFSKYFARKTFPNFPAPSFLPISKSSILILISGYSIFGFVCFENEGVSLC